MRTVITVASMFFCCVSLNAQITSSLVHVTDGADEVRIRNASQTALAAFAVAAKNDSGIVDGGGFLVTYSDTVIDGKAQPLLPGEERQVLRQGIYLHPGSARRPAANRIPLSPTNYLEQGQSGADAVVVLLCPRALLVCPKKERSVVWEGGRELDDLRVTESEIYYGRIG